MKNKIIPGLLVTSSLFVVSFAASYVCPNTYQTIITGYSSAQVAQACGQPANVSTQQQIQTKPIQLQQWIYTASTSTMSPGQSRSKMKVTFNSDNQVTEISVTNQTNTNIFPCYSMGRIQVGSTTQQVQLQCGVPLSVTNIQQGVNTPVTVTTWTYNFGSYKPEMVFTFENDQLTDIKMGQMAK